MKNLLSLTGCFQTRYQKMN